VRRKIPRFIHRLLKAAALEIRRQFLVIPRDRRVRRQIQNVRQIIAGIERRRLKVQNRRNQDDSVQIHPITLLQISG
jgi:hypothetical protein